MDIDDSSYPSHPSHLDPFEHAGNLESTFYNEGYTSGFDHGRLHGLFEGRALGQEKCFELWEEVGYYEGFAGFWVGALQRRMEDGRDGSLKKSKSKDERALSHAKQLLALISTFPTTNPSPSAPQAGSNSSGNDLLAADAHPTSDQSGASRAEPNGVVAVAAEPDLPSLLGSIRGRHKLLCASLGVRPRLVAAPNQEPAEGGPQGSDMAEEGGVVEGIEGPMKGVDTRRLRF